MTREQIVQILFDNILKTEGGLSKAQTDKASKTEGVLYHTNRGVIYSNYNRWCFKALGIKPSYDHFLKLTKDEAKKLYAYLWSELGLDFVADAATASYLYDFCFGSNYAVKRIQEELNLQYKANLKTDNALGFFTGAAINKLSGKEAFDLIHTARVKYYEKLSKDDPYHFGTYKTAWIDRSLKYYNIFISKLGTVSSMIAFKTRAVTNFHLVLIVILCMIVLPRLK